jgi:acetyltransferase-like isoleucine patch superfamily enzyme
MSWAQIVADARQEKGPLKHAKKVWRGLLDFRVPVFRPLAALLYAERDFRREMWPIFLKILYREPLLRYRAEHVGRRVHIEGQLPLIYGDGRIRIGDDVRIGSRNTWTVGYKHARDAELIIGNRVNIGYQNSFSVAKGLTIGDHTIFAPNVQIYDNPTHPFSPAARLRNDAFDVAEARPITIGSNVWLGTGAVIMRGVTIGDGSIVGAGSIVTRDVPPATLVAGNPARVIRSLDD